MLDFIAEVTVHIPPKNKQYIRRYGLYSSRTRGIWVRYPHIIRLAPQGWKEKHKVSRKPDNAPISSEDEQGNANSPSSRENASTWARLIKKVYSVDPLVCPKYGNEMKIIAIILDPKETTKILRHLIRIGRSPPNLDPDILN